MLQRLVFAQKRHLEQCSVLSKPLLFSQHHVQTAPARPIRPPLPDTLIPRSSDADTRPPHPLAAQFASLSTNFDKPITRKNTEQLIHYIRTQPSLVDLFTTGKRVNAFAQHLAKSRTPEYASRILLLAQEMGCSLRPDAYEAVCYHLAAVHQWELILETVTLANQYLRKLTVRLLHWRAWAFLETRRLPQLIHILEEFREHGHRPTRRTFHFIISGYLRNHDLAGAKMCIETMNELGFPPDPTTYSLVTNQYRPFGSDYRLKVSALSSLPDLPRPAATRVLNNLIQSSMDITDDASIRHFLRFFHPHAVSHFKVPLAYGQQPKDKLPQRLELFLLPDSDTYALFIRYAAEKGDHPAAFAYLERMVDSNLPATVDVVVSTLFACFTVGRQTEAFSLFARLCQNALIPSERYEPFLSTSSRTVIDLSFLDIARVPLTTRVCNMMLKHCITRIDLVRSILQIMNTHRLQWSSSTIDILLSHLKQATPTQAEQLMDFILEQATPSTTSTQHLHKIFSAILTDEKRSRPGGIWRKNRTDQPAAASRTSVSQIPPPHRSGTSGSEDPTAGLEPPRTPLRRFTKFQAIESTLPPHFKSDPAMLALRLRRDAVLRGDMESAQRIFQSLLDRGIHPDEYHYSAMIEGYTSIGDFTTAIRTMESAKQAGIQPTVVMYTILICGYAKRKDLDRAVATWRRMIAQGIRPDFAAVDAIIGAHYAAGRFKKAKTLLLQLWGTVQPVPEGYANMKLSWLMARFREMEKEIKAATGRGVLTVEERHQLEAVVRQERRIQFGLARKRPIPFAFSKRRRRRSQPRFTLPRRRPSKSSSSR